MKLRRFAPHPCLFYDSLNSYARYLSDTLIFRLINFMNVDFVSKSIKNLKFKRGFKRGSYEDKKKRFLCI